MQIMLPLTSLRCTLKNISRCGVNILLPRLNHSMYLRGSAYGPPKKDVVNFKWLLLAMPVTAFGLGTWQVKRKIWKESLIKEMNNRTSINPIKLPSTIEEITELEYYPVYVRGHFIHEQEMYLGPRTLLKNGGSNPTGILLSGDTSKTHGFLVITPFKLEDRQETILVNRGWVSTKNKDPKTRTSGQVQGVVELVGVIRLHEHRPQFMPKHNPKDNTYLYRNVKHMSKTVNAAPIYIDATQDFTFKGGPIGGQTLINLRNEHLTYIVTWYSLSIFTGFMWYSQFLKGVRL